MSKRLPFRHNQEKKYFEEWTDDRDPANFIHPYRMCIQGLPNSGKTSTLLSIIARAKPRFDEVILCHAKYFDAAISSDDPKELEIPSNQIDCKEYEGIDFTCCLKSIPLGYTYFKRFQNDNGSKKNLLIIDDIELREWSRASRIRQIALNKLFSYQSTHHGLSVIVTCQDGTTQLNPSVRRECNINIIFRGRDRNAITYQAMCIGFPKHVLVKLFDLCNSNHDSISFDQTDSSPYPIRYNIINNVELVDKSKS